MTIIKEQVAAVAAKVPVLREGCGVNTELAFKVLAAECDKLDPTARVAISVLLNECLAVGQDGVLADSRKNLRMSKAPTLELLVEDECSGFVVRYDVDDDGYFVNFEVFSVVTTFKGAREFHRRGAIRGDDTTPVLDDADVDMHGVIKWDGCSHVSYPATFDGMQHLCGHASWEEWGRLFAALYAALTALLPKYDREVDR
jgi:hypothetical protein